MAMRAPDGLWSDQPRGGVIEASLAYAVRGLAAEVTDGVGAAVALVRAVGGRARGYVPGPSNT